MHDRNRNTPDELAAGLKAGVAIFVIGFIALVAGGHGVRPIDDLPAVTPEVARSALDAYYLPSEFDSPKGEPVAHVEAF